MKMPDVRPKIRKGQLWRHKRANHKGEHRVVLVTSRAQGDYVHTVAYENRNCGHRIRTKDIWLFYDLIERNAK